MPIHHPHPQHFSKTKTYLKVTALTVAPSGRFPRHLLTSSDMDGRIIQTCITGDLAILHIALILHRPTLHPLQSASAQCFSVTFKQREVLSKHN